jgi:hypothetical protein
MFDCNASATQMSSSVYAEHMNCDYNHSLDDTSLRQTIDSLVSRNLISAIGNSASSNDRRYVLTEYGGELWELERRPDWQRYVTTTRKLGNSRSGSIVAICADELIGRKCLGAMFASGLITPTSMICCRELPAKRLIPWKTFPALLALRCRTSDNVHHWPKPIDWDVYESSRCWWRTIRELLTLDR